MPVTRSVFLPDADATQALGAAIGRAARAGDVVAAQGTLGAGKTCLAQGVARGLEVPPTHYVNSPTFAILQSHPGRLMFHHIDLYRIGDADEALGWAWKRSWAPTASPSSSGPGGSPSCCPPTCCGSG